MGLWGTNNHLRKTCVVTAEILMEQEAVNNFENDI
jgi:hypothetical protein